MQTTKTHREIVINGVHGGFRLSDKAIEQLATMLTDEEKEVWTKVTPLANLSIIARRFFGHHRTDERLISVVKALGEEANGSSCRLVIEHLPYDVEIDPDGVGFEIEECDGAESIVERPEKIVVHYLNKVDHINSIENLKHIIGVYDLMKKLELRPIDAQPISL
jgi:hypothetical protein